MLYATVRYATDGARIHQYRTLLNIDKHSMDLRSNSAVGI